MSLEAQPPLRMIHAIGNRKFCVGGSAWSIHRLQEEMFEIERFELGWIEFNLWIDQF